MKPEQERVSNLLLDTISLLCKNGLTFKNKLTIEGLIGITIDDSQVFLVHINEKLTDEDCVNVILNESNEEISGIATSDDVPLMKNSKSPAIPMATQTRTDIRKRRRMNPIGNSPHNQSQLTRNEKNHRPSDAAINLESDEEEEEDIKVETGSMGADNTNSNITDNFPYQPYSVTNKAQNRREDFNLKLSEFNRNVQPKSEVEFDLDATSDYNTNINDIGMHGMMAGSFGNVDDEIDDFQGNNAAGCDMKSMSMSWEMEAIETNSYDPSTSVSYAGHSFNNNARASRKMRPTFSKFATHGFSHIGRQLMQHRRRPVSFSAPPNSKDSSVVDFSDETIKTMTTFICNIDGCTNSFTLKSNLLRHQTQKHGRAKKPRRTAAELELILNQYGSIDEN